MYLYRLSRSLFRVAQRRVSHQQLSCFFQSCQVGPFFSGVEMSFTYVVMSGLGGSGQASGYHIMSDLENPSYRTCKRCPVVSQGLRSYVNMFSHVMPCKVTLRPVMSRLLMSRPVKSPTVLPRHVTCSHVTFCHVNSHHAMPCYAKSSHAISCHINVRTALLVSPVSPHSSNCSSAVSLFPSPSPPPPVRLSLSSFPYLFSRFGFSVL